MLYTLNCFFNPKARLFLQDHLILIREIPELNLVIAVDGHTSAVPVGHHLQDKTLWDSEWRKIATVSNTDPCLPVVRLLLVMQPGTLECVCLPVRIVASA